MAFENNVQATLQANVAIGATTVDVVKAVAPNKDVPVSGRLTLSATDKTEIISYTGRTDNTTYWTLTGVTKNAESSFGDQAWSAGDACFQALTAADVASLSTINSATAPTNPSIGTKWFNTTTGVLAEYLTDGTDSTWIDTSAGSVYGLAAAVTVIAPAAQGYINSENDGTAAGCSYVISGGGGTATVTFNTPMTDTNYSVITDKEGFDEHQVLTGNKSLTSFTMLSRDSAGTQVMSPNSWPYSFVVYASDPVQNIVATKGDTGIAGTNGAVGADGAGTTIVANFDGLIALTGMTAGSQAYVTETNKLYFYTGVGWYLIATVQNDAPSAITGVDGSYSLAIDGTATTITAVSTDPEGFSLTWTYTASGLGSIATVSQADNVFTVTPSTAEANTGSFTLTISVTDGINGAVSTISSFSLFFIISNSKYTTLLAKAVSTGDNNNITDASSNNHTITVAGDTYAGSFSPYRHGGYSTYFDGASDYLEIPNDSSLALAGSPWTIECWVKPSGDYSIFRAIFAKRLNNSASYEGYLKLGTGVVSYYNGTTHESTTVLDANSWSHVAWVYVGGYINIYVNGVRVATSAVTVTDYNYPIVIGGVTGKNEWFQGNIRDFRILKGTALYTGATVTPPTEPLTDITNTSLLTCHLPYIADRSTNAHAITVNGNVSITPVNTYDYSPYSAGTNGGSVYLNGTTDYLQCAANSDFQFGTSDFTVEVWVYFEALPSESVLLSKWNAGGQAGTNQWLLFMDDSTPYFVWSTDGLTSPNAGVTGPNLALNSWHHLAAVRNGSSITLYVNGVPGTSESESGSLYGSETELLGIGYRRDNGSGTSRLTGYMSDIRIVKGTAVYTSNFTPPTAPLSSSGSSLHIKGTDASIIDKSQVSNLKLVGNTTASTTQIKYGNSSIYFDGTGDAVTASSTVANFGTNDFTIEMWVYPTATGRGMLTKTVYTGSLSPPSISIYNAASNLLVGVNEGNTAGSWNTCSAPLLSNQWSHLALTRQGTTLRVFLNGISILNTTNSANVDNNVTFNIGKWRNTSEYFMGYMQDFRITKGLARYTSNFTPSQLGELKG